MDNEVRPAEGALRQLQLLEFDILKKVRDICERNHITYFLSGGTLLGAVRHGGFIPWDDDADVAMLRADYERFRTACRTDLDPGKYYFQDHVVTPGYRWGYGKLRRKDTVFLREHQEHMPYEQGVFITPVIAPAVPEKDVLIRFALMATHTTEQVDEAVAVLTKIFRELGVIA